MKGKDSLRMDFLEKPIPVTDQEWPESTIPLVSISCITYNHEKFIMDAIESFLMQKTTFPVEILIHDDASTDSTPDIVREFESEYPNLIKPIYQEENQYQKGVRLGPYFQYPRVQGKYYATCEGDDYWIDPLKLQKQVEFMEANSAYSLCVSGFQSFNINTNEKKDVIKIPQGVNQNEIGYTFTLNDLKKAWITKTLTSLYRFDKGIINKIAKYKHGRDVNFFYHILKDGSKGFYFTEIMGVYRLHEGGIKSMRKRKFNATKGYNLYKELNQVNKDNFTRFMYMRAAFGLLNYNLYHSYSGNTLKKKTRLFFEAVSLVRSFKELKYVIVAFLPEKNPSKY